MTSTHPISQPIAVVGIAYDEGSSFMKGPKLAPERIREAYRGGSTNSYTELGVDLSERNDWQYVPDLAVDAEIEKADTQIEAGVRDLLDKGNRVLSLGGDHSITYPIMRAVADHYQPLTLIQLDSHPDLWDNLDGNRLSHACPFARIMEDGLVDRLIQIGIRTLTQHQKEQAERFGVEIIHAKGWSLDLMPKVEGNVYLTLDLDVLDPAFAPGVSHHEPGGFSSRQLFDIIQALPGNIISADIVELNPHRDLVDMTAMLAAKCMKEVLAKMLSPRVASG